MKYSQIIFFLAILSICFTQDCTTDFASQLNLKCKNIDSNCKLDDKGCYLRGCSYAKTRYSCERALPSDDNVLHTEKCYWGTREGGSEVECYQSVKTCSNYNIFGIDYKPDGGDTCHSLKTDYTGMKCVLESDIEGGCVARYSSCSECTYESRCNNNLIVNDLKQKCKWDTPEGGSRRSCINDPSGPRTCSEANLITNTQDYNSFRANDTNCYNFPVSSTTSGDSCVSFEGKCREVFKSCMKYNDNQNTCEYFSYGSKRYKRMPVNANGIGFNYFQKCVYNENHPDKCYAVDKTCEDYDEDLEGDDERCVSFKTTDDTKKECVYDPNSSVKCYEKYKSCKLYSENTLDKDRDKCEDSLLDVNTQEECDYILGKDQCQKKTNYSTCDEYNLTGEKDRIKCESIRSPTNHLYCVFDKDNQCIEREPFCSEVEDEDDCLHIAKSTDANKKCAYDGNKCYEEYIRCEDYLGDSSFNCTNIRLYNGLQCEYDSQSNRCRSRNKFCNEARTKEECKLMRLAKIGVSDPDRKVCGDYSYNENIYNPNTCATTTIPRKCQEIFKYCSDYKGSTRAECEKIKPYDEKGEKIDTHSKCIFENYKCQRVNISCEDAGNNPILCSEISDKIKDNSVKYCRFFRDECKTNYKTCEDYKEYSNSNDDTSSDDSTREAYREKETNCTNNIPENYKTGFCKYEKDTEDNNKFKCITDKECQHFNKDSYEQLCNQVDSDCGYDSESATCKKVEKECENIRFYSISDDNEEICKKIEASKPYKICTLKEDKSGCEEIYRDFSFSTASSSYSEPPGSQSQESSDTIKGINLVMILLYLLF